MAANGYIRQFAHVRKFLRKATQTGSAAVEGRHLEIHANPRRWDGLNPQRTLEDARH